MIVRNLEVVVCWSVGPNSLCLSSARVGVKSEERVQSNSFPCTSCSRDWFDALGVEMYGVQLQYSKCLQSGVASNTMPTFSEAWHGKTDGGGEG